MVFSSSSSSRKQKPLGRLWALCLLSVFDFAFFFVLFHLLALLSTCVSTGTIERAHTLSDPIEAHTDTNDKRINSRLICYLFRNCRFECNKIYAMSERGRVHTKDIQREEREKNAKQQQQRRRHRVWSMTMGKYIYLFYCYYLYLLNAEATEAEERSHQGERDVWLLTNIYGPVFGHIQHNWLVTTHHSAYFFASKESIWTKCLESRARHTVIVCAWRIDEAINSFLNALRAFWK